MVGAISFPFAMTFCGILLAITLVVSKKILLLQAIYVREISVDTNFQAVPV